MMEPIVLYHAHIDKGFRRTLLKAKILAYVECFYLTMAFFVAGYACVVIDANILVKSSYQLFNIGIGLFIAAFCTAPLWYFKQFLWRVPKHQSMLKVTYDPNKGRMIIENGGKSYFIEPKYLSFDAKWGVMFCGPSRFRG